MHSLDVDKYVIFECMISRQEALPLRVKGVRSSLVICLSAILSAYVLFICKQRTKGLIELHRHSKFSSCCCQSKCEQP
jgi:hypothetical protein